MLIDTRKSPHAQVCSIPQENISWRDGFWNDVLQTCARVSVPYVLKLFEESDVFHAVENLKVAAGLTEGEFMGPPYVDGDFYKLLESMIYLNQRFPDAALAGKIDAYIDLIAQSQAADGYLSTKQLVGERQSNGERRFGNINDFEIYNMGHLLTAACTHHRITAKNRFLQVAVKVGLFLEQFYREADRTGNVQTAVCPSHYMGLIELYRETGDERYLQTADLSLRLRDRIPNGTDDNQDRYPLLEQDRIIGHAVRSTYLYGGVTDVYLETGDPVLRQVAEKTWHNLTDQKLYINGGCGALYSGMSPFGNFLKGQPVHQAFGYEYQLPNITAYNETCGTLGHIFWTHRLFAADPQARYFDLIEHSLLNLALAAVSLEGNRFFYQNALRRTKSVDYELIWPLERASVLSCFCCPTNLSRVLMGAHEYACMVSDDAVWLGLYGASEIKFNLANGAAFTLIQETEYPWQGKIRLTCRDVLADRPFTLQIRIPGWAESGTLTVNGHQQLMTKAHAGSYLAVPIERPSEMAIEIEFAMPVRLTVAHTKVEEAEGHVAVERGPLLYCLESPDAAVATLDDLLLPSDAVFRIEPLEILGRKMLALATTAVTLQHAEPQDRDALYQPLKAVGVTPVPIRMIPYFAWDNRGFGEMRIWLPVLYRF